LEIFKKLAVFHNAGNGSQHKIHRPLALSQDGLPMVVALLALLLTMVNDRHHAEWPRKLMLSK
jgi:hypothetical protein